MCIMFDTMAGYWISFFVRTLYYCLILRHAPASGMYESMQTHATDTRGKFQIQPEQNFLRVSLHVTVQIHCPLYANSVH